jgi:outer membrane protein W
MKFSRVSALFVIGACAAAPFAMAQTPQINAYFGVGTATDSSSNQQIDTFGTGTPYNTSSLGGLFGNVGAQLMVTPHFGVGGEFSWRFSQAAYAGLQTRPLLYDFNGIWQPIGRTKRFVPELQAGIGGVNLRYYYSATFCDQFVGCSTPNAFLESSNHFQTHFGVGARFYMTPHIFVRPAVDAHWVNNFFQYGSNWVPQYSLSIGYSFGGE